MTTPTSELTGDALLREAAAAIRKDWQHEDSRHFATARAYNLAVADWLERVAEFLDSGAPPLYDTPQALTVARAYLGLS